MIQRAFLLAAALWGGFFAVVPVPTARAEAAAPPPPLSGPKAGGPVETLWVADQFTGMLGMWTRRQQRWLITPEKVFHQDLHLKVGDQCEFESMDALEAFVAPEWFGVEVTDDGRYTNAALALDGLPDHVGVAGDELASS